MWLHFGKRCKSNIPGTRCVQFTAILVLFSLSVLIVACGSPSANANMGQPQATFTIDLNQTGGSPTPPLPAYTCSAWVTNTTPNVNGTTSVDVYAKFVHNVDGNPVGVSPAQGTASVLWPEGLVNVSANTTSDGLAVFPVSIANRSADVNKVVLVTVSFTGPQGVPPCIVSADRAAFFSLIVASPVATSTAGNPPTPGTTGTTPTGTFTPSSSPSPSLTPCPTPKGFPFLTPCP